MIEDIVFSKKREKHYSFLHLFPLNFSMQNNEIDFKQYNLNIT